MDDLRVPCAYFKSIKITGNIFTLTETEKPIFSGYKRSESEIALRQKMLESKQKLLANGTIEKMKPKRIDSIYRASTLVRDLINCNVNQSDNSDVFLTLTYKKNMQDIKSAKNDFKNFIKRFDYYRKKELGRSWEKLRYVYVTEFQKRGAIHFHCIFFGLEKINLKKNTGIYDIHTVWGFGNVDVNSLQHFKKRKFNPITEKVEETNEIIESVDNVGAYITKYMRKGIVDDRLDNSDMYGRSRGNLLEPIKIKDPQQIAILLEGVLKNKLSYVMSYDNDYTGFTIYSQFNIMRKFDSNSMKMKAKYNKIKEFEKNKINKNKINWIRNVQSK